MSLTKENKIESFTEAILAIKSKDLDKFKELIESDKSLLKHIDNEGNNILMVFLSYRGTIVRRQIGSVNTYLLGCDYEPNIDIFNYLMQSDIDLNIFNNQHETPLSYSLRWYDNDDTYMTYALLKNGADPFLKNSNNWSFMDRVLCRSGNEYLVEHVYQNVIEKHKLAFQQELEEKLEEQKQYYEQKLVEQKEQLLDELYRPDGLGYTVAKERFEKN